MYTSISIRKTRINIWSLSNVKGYVFECKASHIRESDILRINKVKIQFLVKIYSWASEAEGRGAVAALAGPLDFYTVQTFLLFFGLFFRCPPLEKA